MAQGKSPETQSMTGPAPEDSPRDTRVFGEAPDPAGAGGLTRRHLLAVGTRLTVAGSLGALFTGLGYPQPAQGETWARLFSQNHEGGYGKVKSLLGRASANGRELFAADRVASGERIVVAPKSRLILALSDNTIMRINANTSVELEIGAHRTGLFRLLVGSLLTVMPTGNRYLAHMPTTVIGIKGTVFFQQIFHPGERVALNERKSRVILPEGISEYFCLCNGEADYLDPQATKLNFRDRSQYHNSYYIDPTRPEVMVKAPQLNHTDAQIRELISQQEGEKHDASFMSSY